MNKTTFLKGFKSTILTLLFGVTFAAAAQTNIAPLATVIADGAGGGGCLVGACTAFNDSNFGSCGTQEVYLKTSSPVTGGTNFIEFTFPSTESFDTIVIYNGFNNKRVLSGGTIEYWNGTAWVTHSSFSNLPDACSNKIGIGLLTTNRFRITSFVLTGSQPSNPAFREIAVISAASGTNDAAVLAVDSPSAFCAGVQPVYATIANAGVNQINSVTVNWAVNGVTQTPLVYSQLLDVATGPGNSTASVLLGTANFNTGVNTIKVFTSLPNNLADTININDTIVASPITASTPTGINFISATLTSAKIHAVGGAGMIDYEYGSVGFTPTTGTSGTAASSVFTISGLSTSTLYDVYVRSNCGSGDFSSWVGPLKFGTAIGVPYFEDFESFAPGIDDNPWPSGWNSSNGSLVPNWESEDSQGSNENSNSTGPFYDHTTPSTSGGMYLFLETSGSGGSLGDSADMISPSIYIDSNYRSVLVEFYYHMFGSTMGDLKLYADTNGVSNLVAIISGKQQNSGGAAWEKASLNLVGYEGKSVKLRFTGVRGSNYYSDMSIDDIRISKVAPINAGLTEILNPSGALCPGTLNPVVVVQNFGADVLNNVKVMWNVNGVLDSLVYTTPIQTGKMDTITLSALSISSTSFYDIKFYTKDPNGFIDTLNTNDTLSLQGIRTGLSGVYTLDPSLTASASNFTSIASMTQGLLSYGLCGPTTINFAPNAYTEVINLNNVAGLSATNTLTLDGGDSSTTFVTAGASDFAALTLSNVEYIIVKNITFESFSILNSAGILIADANHITITNCAVQVDQTSPNSSIYAISLSGSSTNNSTGAETNYITIANNYINGGYYGFRVFGSNTKPAVGNVVRNNQFVNQYTYGAYFNYADSNEFIGNDVDVTTRANANADGVNFRFSSNFKLNENKIAAVDQGVYLFDIDHYFPQTRKNEIINNMISAEVGYGLSMNYIDSTNIYHNTIVSNSNSVPALEITSNTANPISNYDMRNNIVYSNGSYAVSTDISDAFFSMMDYNTYYTSGNALLSINGLSYASLASYAVAKPAFNANSFEGAPMFVNYPTDLHVITGVVSNSGDNTVGISTDIDGEMRPSLGATTVDIGADEFLAPAIELGLARIQSPFTACDLTSTEQVIIDIVNTGQNAVSNFTVGFSVDGGAYVTETIAGPLASTSNQIYTFTATANLSAAGAHTIDAFVFATGDLLAYNDSASTKLVNVITSTNPTIQTFDVLPDGETDFSAINWIPISAGSFIWRADTGSTGSSNTGPLGDNTGSGTYIYSEASSGTTGDTIYLESPCVDVTPVNGVNSSTRVDYWYHMYGADVVALGLDINSGGTWIPLDTIVGQQQTASANTFRLKSLDISAYQNLGITSFRFWTVKGNSNAGDVSIDDFRVYDVVSTNASLDSIISPTSNCGMSAMSNVTVKISNVGLTSFSNFPVSYELNGGTAVTETVTATMLPNTSMYHTFTTTVNLQAVGSYSLKAYVGVTNDGNLTNDTVVSTINSGFSQVLNQSFTYYYNDFEGTTNNWVASGANNSWEIGTPSTFYINKPAAGMNAYVTSAAGNYNANELSYAETPCFDLSAFQAVDEFDMSFETLFRTESDSDKVWMESTIDNGATWTKIMPSALASNFYNNSTNNVWTGFSNGGVGTYIPVTNAITGIGGVSQVKFRFVFESNGSNQNDGFAFDNFRINSPLYNGVGSNSLTAASFGLYPNPANENVTISFNNVETGNYELSIEDVKGQKVMTEVIAVKNSNSRKEINTSQFKSGVYFVRLVNGTSIVTKKLVVN